MLAFVSTNHKAEAGGNVISSITKVTRIVPLGKAINPIFVMALQPCELANCQTLAFSQFLGNTFFFGQSTGPLKRDLSHYPQRPLGVTEDEV